MPEKDASVSGVLWVDHATGRYRTSKLKKYLRVAGAMLVMSLLRLRGTGGGGSTYAPCRACEGRNACLANWQT